MYDYKSKGKYINKWNKELKPRKFQNVWYITVPKAMILTISLLYAYIFIHKILHVIQILIILIEFKQPLNISSTSKPKKKKKQIKINEWVGFGMANIFWQLSFLR